MRREWERSDVDERRRRPSNAAAPRHSKRANAVDPSGRCARTSRTRPPTKAQTRPASMSSARVTTIPKTSTRCGSALPTRRYGPMVSSSKAVTVAPTAARSRVIWRVDPRRCGPRSATADTAPQMEIERRRRRSGVSHGPTFPAMNRGHGSHPRRTSAARLPDVHACRALAGGLADAAVSRETNQRSVGLDRIRPR